LTWGDTFDLVYTKQNSYSRRLLLKKKLRFKKNNMTTVFSPRGSDLSMWGREFPTSDSVSTSDNFCMQAYCLKNVIESALTETTMHLWGEYDQVTDDDLMQIILPHLKQSSWRTLDLRRNPLTRRGVQALLKAIPNSNVKELCLGALGLGDEGARIVADALPFLKLDSLNLFDNGISNKGIQSIAFALKKSTLKVLILDNNDISDDGAMYLSKGISSSCLQRLTLNMNSLSSFGADRLVDTIKHSSLRSLAFRGNEKVYDHSYLRLSWIQTVYRSDWYRICMVLLSVRGATRAGANSPLSKLPSDLTRRLCSTLCDIELHIDDSFDEIDNEDLDEDRAGYEEDYFAAVTHQRRRCSSLASVILADIMTKADINMEFI